MMPAPSTRALPIQSDGVAFDGEKQPSLLILAIRRTTCAQGSGLSAQGSVRPLNLSFTVTYVTVCMRLRLSTKMQAAKQQHCATGEQHPCEPCRTPSDRAASTLEPSDSEHRCGRGRLGLGLRARDRGGLMWQAACPRQQNCLGAALGVEVHKRFDPPIDTIFGDANLG